MEEVIKKSEEVGKLKERARIMSEIDIADLPAGVWTKIRTIINPDASPL